MNAYLDTQGPHIQSNQGSGSATQQPGDNGFTASTNSTFVGATVLVSSGVIVAIGGLGAGGQIFQVTMSFLKLFQIVEILGKLIFVPVYYSGLILDILTGVYNLSDAVDISPEMITDGKYEDSIAGYMGKITFYEEYGNIL